MSFMFMRRRLASGSVPVFSTLFQADEPGLWLDPADLMTLFQDSAGSIPVTAAGQSVGLVLDKSQGLALGAELAGSLPTPAISNFGGSSGSWSGASLTMTNSALSSSSSYPRFQFNLGLTANARYHVVGRVTGDIAALSAVSLNVSGTVNLVTYDPATGIFEARQVAGGAILEFRLNGTLAVPKSVQIAEISVRLLSGYHAAQTTAAARPTYQVDGTGRPYLSFDGVDDFLVTPTITPGTDKAQVFAGVRKLSDAAQRVVAELSASTAANNGALLLAAPDGASATFAFDSKGTIQTDAVVAGQTAPLTAVLTGLGDIAGDSAILRVNGAVADTDTGDQGTGNYLAYPIYIGRRGGTTLPFSGWLYSLAVRFGANLAASVISKSENQTAAKAGVTL